MKLRISYITLVFVGLFFNMAILKSQCSSCTFTASSSVSSYTLNSGQVLCVNAGDDYTGAIYLSGGVICNSGTIHNIIYQSGTGLIENYGTYAHTGNINFNLAGELVMNCYSGSIIRITGDVTAHGSLLSHMLTIRQFGGSILDIGGKLNCSGGRLRIIANSSPEQRFALRNIFNIGDQFSVTGRGNLNLNINEYSTFNVFGSANFMGSGIKQITNSGEMNFNQNFSIGGNGGGFGFFNLKNYANFSVGKFFNASYLNGTTIIENYSSAGSDVPRPIDDGIRDSIRSDSVGGQRILGGLMYIGKSYSQGNENTSFYNFGNVNVVQDIKITKGTLSNSGFITSRDIEVKNGNLTNNRSVVCNRDFVTSNSAAVVNNNNEIRVAREFSNKGTVNFGKKSLLLTNDFTHLSSGNIYGPGELSILNGVLDSSDYALIDIMDYSDNNGNLRQHLIVYDENFSGTGIALDNYHGDIARLGMPPVIIGRPPCFRNIFAVSLTSNPANPICKGTSVLLTANAYNTISSGPAPVNNYLWLPDNITTNPPTNTFNTAVINNNSVFSVNVTLSNGCVITNNINIVISSLTANAGPDKFIKTSMLPVSIGLPIGASGGTPPYNYSWAPASTLSNPLISNPNATPASNTSYILTVTDNDGCTSTDGMDVLFIPDQYARLNKKLDGGYYKLVNDRLFFKTDEEYTTTAIKYNIYNMARVLSNSGANINTLVSASGDNRYELDCSSAILNSGYYILEVINDKNESLYLRFKK